MEKLDSLTETRSIVETEPNKHRDGTESTEDIRDLKINKIMADLKKKKFNMSNIEKREVEVSNKQIGVIKDIQNRNKSSDELKKEIFREERLDMSVHNERFLYKQQVNEQFYEQERLKYRDVHQANLQDMIEANQTDIQMLLIDVKSKNKSFLEAILDE